ncbi:MAG: carbohydrate ABC transporter permease [Caldilineaceae bacterium]|nr:carbohydrate ABC transporter permease [Caldilineaceae bacterium]
MIKGNEVYSPVRGKPGTDWQLLTHKVASVVGRIVLYLVIAAGAVIFILPLIWMISTSVKPDYQLYNIPIIWIPDELDWQNYVDGWRVLPFPRFYWNTTYVTIVNIIGLVFSSSLVAFGFARIRFWGRDAIFIILLATMMLPSQVTLIPIYLFWSQLGLVNSFWPLIIPQWLTNAYNVFLLRQFFMSINMELDDAARIDGASWFRIYWNILMPLSKPALGVIAIQAFAFNWNNFIDPLIYLNDPKKYTIAIGLRLFQTQQSQKMAETMAMTLVALVPVLVVFYIAQAKFIQGIVISGVKG